MTFHYIEKSHSHAHDCLICIGTQTQWLTRTDALRTGAVLSADGGGNEGALRRHPEAVKNTLAVAEQCNLEIEFGKLHFPVFAPPEHFTREGYLRKLIAEGLLRRYTLHAKAEGKESSWRGLMIQRGCRRTKFL